MAVMVNFASWNPEGDSRGPWEVTSKPSNNTCGVNYLRVHLMGVCQGVLLSLTLRYNG
jgi:hypothetical protein